MTRRSNPQNRFFYGVMLPKLQAFLCRHFDNPHITPEAAKEWAKLQVGFVRWLSGFQLVTRSMAELDVPQQEQFNDALRARLAPWGCELPYPNEVPISAYFAVGGE